MIHTSYCKKCKMNLCLICEKEHNKEHNLILYRDLTEKKDNIKNILNEFKKKLDKLNNDIKEMIDKLKYVIEKINIYYEINYDIINNYEQ